MRLEWLEDILAVAETGSFSEAAERRHLTQSAFSRRIRNIEETVGVELFDRTRKPVQLHPATGDQREQIGRLAAGLRQLIADLRRGDRMSGNRLVIASQHALTTAITPAIIKGIQERNEDIYVRLRSANLDECFGLLLSRQADIALVYRLPGEDHPISADYIETAILGADRLIPVFLAAGMADLRGRMQAGEVPYIAYPGHVFLGQVMERAVLPRIAPPLRPVARAETALTLAALEMAAVGAAVAWVPASLATSRIAESKLADLSDILPDSPLEVTAVRLSGRAGPVEIAVWSRLIESHPPAAVRPVPGPPGR